MSVRHFVFRACKFHFQILSKMAQEVARDKYKGSTIGEYDPIAAFLTLKCVTEGDNSRTNLRKLGKIAGYQMESFPYIKGTV